MQKTDVLPIRPRFCCSTWGRKRLAGRAPSKLPQGVVIQGGGTSHGCSPFLSKLSIQCFGGNHPQPLFTQPRTPRVGGSPVVADPIAASPMTALTRTSPVSSALAIEYVTR